MKRKLKDLECVDVPAEPGLPLSFPEPPLVTKFMLLLNWVSSLLLQLCCLKPRLVCLTCETIVVEDGEGVDAGWKQEEKAHLGHDGLEDIRNGLQYYFLRG